ncbi:hypothetical protein D3C84_1015990 [compost metagenome]
MPSTSSVPANTLTLLKPWVPIRVAIPVFSFSRSSKLVVLLASNVKALALFSTTVSLALPPLTTLLSTAPSLRVSVSSPSHKSMVPEPDTVPDTVMASLPSPQP